MVIVNDCVHWESPVGFGEQDGQIRLADEVFVGHLADSGGLFLPARQDLQVKWGLDWGPHHAQVRGQQVDEDLRGETRQQNELTDFRQFWTCRLSSCLMGVFVFHFVNHLMAEIICVVYDDQKIC